MLSQVFLQRHVVATSACGLLLISAAIVWIVFYHLFVADFAEVDDSDLAVAPLRAVGGENGYTYFDLARRQFTPPGRDDSLYEAYRAWILRGEYDPDLAEAMWDRCKAIWPIIDKGLACEISEFARSPDGSYRCLPYQTWFYRLGEVMNLRAAQLAMAGKYDEFVAEVIRIMAFADSLCRSGAGRAMVMEGIDTKLRCLLCVRDAASTRRVPSKYLVKLSEELRKFGTTVHAFEEALQADYARAKEHAAALADGDYEYLIAANIDPERFRYAFCKNKTIELLASSYRMRIQSLHMNVSSAEELLSKDPVELLNDLLRKRTGKKNISDYWENLQDMRFLYGNELGIQFCFFERGGSWLFYSLPLDRGTPLDGSVDPELIVPPTYASVFTRAILATESARLSNTRLVLALRAHEQDKGVLPDVLGDLVPDYIDAIPQDDFDGDAMRYSRERRLVFSVGDDLSDDDGDKDSDIVFAIGLPPEPLEQESGGIK